MMMVIAMLGTDMSTGEGVSSMIGFSVRWAVPFIFLVVPASSVQILFPSTFSRWWLQNRKYIGLCFAVAMAWQGLFIAIMSNFFNDYYYEDIYLLRDEIEGSIGYIFLTAMVVTSFSFGSRHVNPKQWKLIHKSGIYFLWAYPFSVYWWNLSYYGNPETIDYIFYWCGFLAFALRIAAWGKKRLRQAAHEAPEKNRPIMNTVCGGALILFGLYFSMASLYNQEALTTFLTTPKWSEEMVLWFPYWPFEPYISLFILGLGTQLVTSRRTS
jgi:DMSO/TMAO reductase YedYZ heme-binding membrane subunit